MIHPFEPAFEAAVSALEVRYSKKGRFKELCGNVFGSPEGAELLAMLCTIEHPCDHTFCAEPRAASHQSGRREVIATLWRYASSTNYVLQIQPTETDGQTT